MLICVNCLTNMRPEKNGVLVARDKYCVQSADLYKCPECGVEMLTGAGKPFEWEYAESVYDREARKNQRLYKIDAKVILSGEDEPKEITVIDG